MSEQMSSEMAQSSEVPMVAARVIGDERAVAVEAVEREALEAVRSTLQSALDCANDEGELVIDEGKVRRAISLIDGRPSSWSAMRRLLDAEAAAARWERIAGERERARRLEAESLEAEQKRAAALFARVADLEALLRQAHDSCIDGELCRRIEAEVMP